MPRADAGSKIRPTLSRRFPAALELLHNDCAGHLRGAISFCRKYFAPATPAGRGQADSRAAQQPPRRRVPIDTREMTGAHDIISCFSPRA